MPRASNFIKNAFTGMANKITGANAGGPRKLAIQAPWAAGVAQFCRSVAKGRCVSCMDDSKRKQIADAFAALPDGCKYARATESELVAFESTFGTIPDDFRWFLIHCGGGTIGSEWVDGISKLAATHHKFSAESAMEDGWTMEGVFVIGWDGAGNPFGIDTATGRILVEDHNFGGIHEMSPSFEAHLEGGLLPHKPRARTNG